MSHIKITNYYKHFNSFFDSLNKKKTNFLSFIEARPIGGDSQ